jgi:hypothetical protein
MPNKKFKNLKKSCSPIMMSVLSMIGILFPLNKGMWHDRCTFHFKLEVKSSNPFCYCKVFHSRWFSFEKEWLSFFLRWWNPSNTKSSLISFEKESLSFFLIWWNPSNSKSSLIQGFKPHLKWKWSIIMSHHFHFMSLGSTFFPP